MKKAIVVTGRVHPGESNSSWIVHGLIQYLLSPTKTANELRKNFIFYIVPMLNPDGVIAGNHRTSLIGKDSNRSFTNPNPKLNPETFYMRSLLTTL